MNLRKLILKFVCIIILMIAWDIDTDTDFSGILPDQKLYKEKNGNVLFISINHNFGKIRIDLFSFLPV